MGHPGIDIEVELGAGIAGTVVEPGRKVGLDTGVELVDKLLGAEEQLLLLLQERGEQHHLQDPRRELLGL